MWAPSVQCSAAQGEAQLQLGGPLQAPPPKSLSPPSYLLSTSPAPRGGEKDVQGDMKSQALFPNDMSFLSCLPIPPCRYLSHLKAPYSMGTHNPFPWGAQTKHTNTER